jgi:hypothetical protein
MAVTLRVSGLGSVAAAFESLPTTMEAGVKVTGESVAYALVWEWGYATRKIQPGPKTQWGTNPDGESKVLTIVAPSGYIRVHRTEYEQVLRDEFSKSGLHLLPLSRWEEAMTVLLNKAADRCTEIIRDAAPVDSGQLRSDIQPATVGDSALGDESNTGFDVGSQWLGGQ